MPTPPPLSTLFPYTTLFRSPIASPLTEKEQQSLLLEAETLLDIPQALLPLPSAVPFSQKWRRPQRWLLLRRSEEHTSELQSHHDLVCRLLLEKKNTRRNHAATPHLIDYSSSNAHAPPAIHTLSLHDALPISNRIAINGKRTAISSS